MYDNNRTLISLDPRGHCVVVETVECVGTGGAVASYGTVAEAEE